MRSGVAPPKPHSTISWINPRTIRKLLSGNEQGIVTRVRGSVVDVEFAEGPLPAINDAMMIELDGKPQLIAEIQEHLDLHTVRAVAMENTSGLRRGAIAPQRRSHLRAGGREGARPSYQRDRRSDRSSRANRRRRTALADSSQLAHDQSSGSQARGLPHRHQGSRPSRAARARGQSGDVRRRRRR